MVELGGAFFWPCPECSADNFIKATEGFLPEDVAAVANGEPPEGDYDCHFVTADAVNDPENPGGRQSAYLVTRVLCAPSFVTCRDCGRTFPAAVPGEPEGEDE